MRKNRSWPVALLLVLVAVLAATMFAGTGVAYAESIIVPTNSPDAPTPPHPDNQLYFHLADYSNWNGCPTSADLVVHYFGDQEPPSQINTESGGVPDMGIDVRSLWSVDGISSHVMTYTLNSNVRNFWYPGYDGKVLVEFPGWVPNDWENGMVRTSWCNFQPLVLLPTPPPQPDLYLGKARVFVSRADGQVWAEGLVMNIGDIDSNVYDVAVFAADQTVAINVQINNPPLKPGEVAEFSIPLGAVSGEDNSFRVLVSAAHEANWEDNEMTVDLEVEPSWPTVPALAEISVNFVAVLADTEVMTVTAQVANEGWLDTEVVVVMESGGVKAKVFIDNLPSLKDTLVRLVVPHNGVPSGFLVSADPENHVREYSVDNNSFSKPAPQADIVSYVYFKPSVDGDGSRMDIVFANEGEAHASPFHNTFTIAIDDQTDVKGVAVDGLCAMCAVRIHDLWVDKNGDEVCLHLDDQNQVNEGEGENNNTFCVMPPRSDLVATDVTFNQLDDGWFIITGHGTNHGQMKADNDPPIVNQIGAIIPWSPIPNRDLEVFMVGGLAVNQNWRGSRLSTPDTLGGCVSMDTYGGRYGDVKELVETNNTLCRYLDSATGKFEKISFDQVMKKVEAETWSLVWLTDN